jgi:hypothetical protein
MSIDVRDADGGKVRPAEGVEEHPAEGVEERPALVGLAIRQ